MGWASATLLFMDAWKVFRPLTRYLPENLQIDLGLQLIEVFEEGDWDTVDEIADYGDPILQKVFGAWCMKHGYDDHVPEV